MKIMMSLVTVLSLSFSHSALATEDPMKRFEVESGKITYELSGSTHIMGVKSATTGHKTVLFKDYGFYEITDEKKTETKDIMGQVEKTEAHTQQLLKDDKMYVVDFEQKKITRMPNVGVQMFRKANTKHKTATEVGEELMKSMGGKKTGSDEVAGFKCDIWELMGTKQCMYKGISLRTEANIMGVKMTELATKVEFDIETSEEDFKLPDFEITDQELLGAPANLGMDQLNQFSDSKDTSMGDMQEVMKQVGKMLGDTGLKQDEMPNAEQMQQLQEALQGMQQLLNESQ